jgi:hypothetical protein
MAIPLQPGKVNKHTGSTGGIVGVCHKKSEQRKGKVRTSVSSTERRIHQLLGQGSKV